MPASKKRKKERKRLGVSKRTTPMFLPINEQNAQPLLGFLRWITRRKTVHRRQLPATEKARQRRIIRDSSN